MSNLKEILAVVLSEERSSKERIASLRELSDLLKEEEAILQLADAARREKSIEVRGEMLGLLLRVSITQLKDRTKYFDCLLYFASMEPEEDLRLAAVRALVELAPEEEAVQEVLGETLECDLSRDVQSACLEGLFKIARKGPALAKRIVAFSASAPRELRPRLLDLIKQLDGPSAEEAIQHLLQPDESPEMIGAILGYIASRPDLSASMVKALSAYLAAETRADVRAQVISVLREARTAPAKLFKAVFEILGRLPDGPELLAIFTNRLGSKPELVEGLEALFTDATSARLKVAVLKLLKDVPTSSLLAPALKDPNPWVRWTAIGLCRDAYPSHPKEIGTALLEALPKEPLADLREAAARLLAGTGRREPKLDRFLVEWLSRETDPRIEEALVGAVLGVAITDENRAVVLKSYRKVLTEPSFSPKLKGQVGARLVSFAYRNEPELVECLKALLERTTQIEQVESYYEHLRKLETDTKSIADLMLMLFYRWLHHFPRDPLHGFLKIFKELAAEMESVREQIPYIVQLSGATWILEGADTSARKDSFLPIFKAKVREGDFGSASKLVNEAWEQRTLKKADLGAAFVVALDTPPEQALQQTVFKLMSEAKFVTPEIVDRCFKALRDDPNGMGAHEIKKFLEAHGSLDLGFRAKALKAFNQADYTDFCRVGTPSDIRALPKNWNDWEYNGWRLAHRDWPMAELFMGVHPTEELAQVLGEKPSVPVFQSIQYLALDLLWRVTNTDWAEYCKRGPEPFEFELRAVAAAVETARGDRNLEPLKDRAVLIFWKRWKDYLDKLKGKPPPKDLAKAAAEVYLEILGLQKTFGEFKEKPLAQLDVEHLQKIWEFGTDAWTQLYENHFQNASEEEEKQAKELYEHAAGLLSKNQLDDAIPSLQELIKKFKHTKFVRAKRKGIDSVLNRKK